MLSRSDMLEIIRKALQRASDEDIRKIYQYLAGMGIVGKEADHECKD